MIEFHRYFERFAASLVRCLSEASYARKTSESATGQNTVNGIRFSDLIYMFLFQFILNTLHFQINFYFPQHNPNVQVQLSQSQDHTSSQDSSQSPDNRNPYHVPFDNSGLRIWHR